MLDAQKARKVARDAQKRARSRAESLEAAKKKLLAEHRRARVAEQNREIAIREFKSKLYRAALQGDKHLDWPRDEFPSLLPEWACQQGIDLERWHWILGLNERRRALLRVKMDLTFFSIRSNAFHWRRSSVYAENVARQYEVFKSHSDDVELYEFLEDMHREFSFIRGVFGEEVSSTYKRYYQNVDSILGKGSSPDVVRAYAVKRLSWIDTSIKTSLKQPLFSNELRWLSSNSGQSLLRLMFNCLERRSAAGNLFANGQIERIGLTRSLKFKHVRPFVFPDYVHIEEMLNALGYKYEVEIQELPRKTDLSAVKDGNVLFKLSW